MASASQILQKALEQGKGVFRARGLFVDGPETGECVDLIGQRNRNRDRARRHVI